MLCKLQIVVAVQARSVGVVSKDSVTAWLLVPRTGPTQAWMKRSEPGQVFAVVKADSKNRVTHKARDFSNHLNDLGREIIDLDGKDMGTGSKINII